MSLKFSLEQIQQIVFVANNKIRAFKLKLELCKTCICYRDSDSFPILKTFLMRSVVILMKVILGGNNTQRNVSAFGRFA